MGTIPRFRPLNEAKQEVRLLELLPGRQTDEIVCKLHIHSLLTNPEYEALSYVWGSKDDKFSLSLCGEAFQAQKSLEACLRHLRRRNSSRVLWIDSLCIDQDNISERNSQVKMMTTVYRSAFRVIAWLDGYHFISPDTIAFVKRRAADENLHFDRQPLPRGEAEGPPEHRADMEDYLQNLFFNCVEDRWWYRMWTFQEAVLATSLELHGPYGNQVCHIDWQTFVKFAASFGRHVTSCCPDVGSHSAGASLAPKLRTVVQIADFQKRLRERDSLSLTSIVPYVRDRRCTDPRDHFFGLLGMCQNIPAAIVDYNLSVNEVHARATAEVIRSETNLDVLGLIIDPRLSIESRGSREVETSPGPSWVVNWTGDATYQARTRSIIFDQTSKPSEHDAAGDTQPRIEIQAGVKLSCAGGVVDRVARVCAQPMPGELRSNIDQLLLQEIDEYSPAIFIIVVRSWREEFGIEKAELCWRGPDSQASLSNAKTEAFWVTLLGDRPWDLARLNSERQRLTPAPGLCELWWERFTEHIDVMPEFVDPTLLWLQDLIHKHCAFKNLFVTENGRFGIGPLSTRPGDDVVILFGGRTPYICRHRSEGSEDVNGKTVREHSFIGSAYVHGIMNGEVVDDIKAQVDNGSTVVLV